MVDNDEYDTLSPREFDVEYFYTAEQLPENDMHPEGSPKPEWVADDLLAVLSDGIMLEFETAYKCTAVYEIREEDGTVGEVYSGEPR